MNIQIKYIIISQLLQHRQRQIKSMAEQQIEQLKSKLESQAQQFENYKAQCKQLQQFLQEQSSKKEDEIRKLKEQSIKKQKNYGLLKNQVSQLQGEIVALKAELQEKQGNAEGAQGLNKQIEKHKSEVQSLTKQNNELKSNLTSMQAEKTKLNEKVEQLSSLEGSSGQKNTIIKQLETEIAYLNSQLSKKFKKMEQNSDIPQTLEKPPNHEAKSTASKANHNNANNEQIKSLQKQLSQSKQQAHRAEQTASKLLKQLKQLKQKSNYLSADRQKLSKKVKQLASSLSVKKQQFIKDDSNQHQQQFGNENQHQPAFSKDNLSVSALIMTKKHYISPFLELKGQNTIKLYKNTKNGCFEKSLGAMKFKLNQISYDTENIVTKCSKTIIDNFNNNVNSSILFYGAKKTSKKYLMAHVIQSLRQTIANWIDGSQDNYEAAYIKASLDTQKRVNIQGKDREQVLRIIDTVIQLAQKSPKKGDKFTNKKKPSKPKVRYLRLIIDNKTIQLITSSHTNISQTPSNNVSPHEYLNNICYSKLPNILQQTNKIQNIFILTINPIVSLYEDCRNTLDIANCRKYYLHSQNYHNMNEYDGDDIVDNNYGTGMGSPSKEDIFTESAKKKFESIEKQSEQNSLKIRRLEDEISYYRLKFDELEVRLKNLLNTHASQNSYLKKSPVTLSYEKMLKFIHSVLSRNGTASSTAVILKTSEFHQQSFNIDDGYASGEQIL